MYIEPTCMEILYGEITYVYKRITWWLCMWSSDLRSLSHLIYKKILYFDLVTCYLNRGNERADIGYNMNYMKVFEWLRKHSSS
jgi:hypothetical protein